MDLSNSAVVIVVVVCVAVFSSYTFSSYIALHVTQVIIALHICLCTHDSISTSPQHAADTT
jgi:hypothetical protein